MTIVQALILGIIEGITEFLPISSTGHLILTSKLLGVADSDFTKSFEIAIQFGAILSVVVLFKNFYKNKDNWKKVFTAFIPTAIIGFLLYRIIKEFLLSNALIVVWSLFLGGIALIVFELWYKRIPFGSAQGETAIAVSDISYKKSFLTGVFQSLAIIPGVSRSGATIIGGLFMGISRQAIVEFSFLLAVPTMAAATGYDLFKSAGSFFPPLGGTPPEAVAFNPFLLLAVGFFTSFFVAMLSIKWLLYFIKNHTFIFFGVYRIIAALIFWLIIK
ncbi:MAG: undecaprenyl-diphosphate phosphatase [Candidatus Staskawiczbacteria bacterium]|nr:undecaprenyl-diphosphate phosphatase [Candidatus Staskawiczbacteria bacterium]